MAMAQDLFSNEGMAYIEALRAEARRAGRIEHRKPSKRIGSFGIRTEKGEEMLYAWVLSGDRSDRRHGPLDPAPKDEYQEHLFDCMFSKWNEEEVTV